MKIGLGHLRLQPSVFWGLSLVEWAASIDGYSESLGGEARAKPMNKGEVKALFESLEH